MIETIIRKNMMKLTEKEQQIGNYILENKKNIINLTSTQLGEKIGSSQSSIIKFIKKIGFNKFSDFKIQLGKDLENKKNSKTENFHSSLTLEDSFEEIAHKVLNSDIYALEKTIYSQNFENLEEIVQKIKNSKRILIIGTGMSSIVAQDLELKLMKIKIDAKHYQSTQMQLMNLATLSEEDLVIAISHRGETEEVIKVINKANELGIDTISITTIESNTVSKLSKYNLKTISEETIFRSSAISSRMAQLILIDILFLRLVQENYQETKEYIDKSKKIVGWLK